MKLNNKHNTHKNHSKCITENDSYCWCLIAGLSKDLYMEDLKA